ncbi:ABC transporter substrate-binding protein [Methyloglobulus sp.]|uniref:ABC transporter substrate-binding protein n=1 Tax=Methyloglobulus sp. TaxID=2518622 RepID=UPI0039894462
MNKNSLRIKSKFWIAGLILIFATGSLLTWQSYKSSSPTPEPIVQLRDILLLSQTQISSFDPLDAFHEGHIQIVKQVYETLTDVDEHGQCVPLLADKWETTDNKIWRFHLKNNVFFSTSPIFATKAERHLEAADVVYSFQRLLSPESKSLGVAYFRDIAGLDEYRASKQPSLRGVRAISNDVVEFELTQPDAGFFCVVSLPFASIVKQQAVTRLGEDFKLKPIGTGSFLLTSYEPDQRVVLSRNPDFRQGPNEPTNPAVEEVRIQLTRDENAAYAAFSNGATDFLSLDFAGLTRFRQQANVSTAPIVSQPTAKLQFYLFNLKTVAKSKVRHAISAAVNRAKIQELIGDSGLMATSVFPAAIFPELSGKHPALDSTNFKSAHKTTPKRKRLAVLRLVCFNDTLSRAVASRIADDLQAEGYTVKIEAAAFPVLVERLTRGEYDLIQLYWGPLYAEPAHYLGPFLTSQFPPQGNNFNQYSNASFDQRIASAKASSNAATRRKLFLEAQDVLLKDMPLLLLYFENLVRVSDNKFTLPTHPLLYRRYSLAQPQ